MAGSSDLDLARALVALEHSVLYGYGELGGVLAAHGGSHDAVALARAQQRAHRDQRDRLADAVLARKGEVPAAAAAYELPSRPTDARGALVLAVQLEQRCATAYHEALGRTDDASLRSIALAFLSASAVAGMQLRRSMGQPLGSLLTALPGATT